MNHVYLVRHGENPANLTLEFSHRKVDYPLTPKGILQAEQTAEFFRGKAIHEIYASPLIRAIQTAEIIGRALGLPVTVMEQFREVDVGELEGQKPTTALWDLHNHVIAQWLNGHPDARFPGGEDYHTLLRRTADGLAAVLAGKEGRGMIIAGHGGIFSFPLLDLCRPLDPLVLKKGVPNCAVTELLARFENGKVEAQLLSFASAAHLSGDAARKTPGLPIENDPRLRGSRETA